jgi:uroporphyrinogen III methyltransferase/synthase
MEGKVYLVGCGIAKEHLTVEAANAIKNADVLLYDRLIDKEILKLNKKAKKVYVGKRPGESLKQSKINGLMIRYVSKGKIVARLKAGDAFLFSRGFEEYLFLKQKGIDVKVIPGVSAFQFLEKIGIPLTYRESSSSIALITGSRADKTNNYGGICADTLVFYMPVVNLKKIIGKLKSNGKHLKSDFVIVEDAFRENYRVVNGNISNILGLAKEAEIKPPALLVVGKINRKLNSNKLVMFRQKEVEKETISKLKRFRIINYPLFKIKHKKIKNIPKNKIYAFTSPNAVKSVFSQVKLKGRFVAIGDITKKEIERYVKGVVVPGIQSSAGLMDYLRRYSKKDVIVFCSRLTTVKGYRKIYCYDTNYVKKALRLEGIIENVDVVFPTSSEVLRHLVKLVGKGVVNKKTIVVIGTEVAKTAKQLGVHVDFMLEKPDISGLNALL